jgi:hypothetical protein
MTKIYNPFEFIDKVELFTIAMIGSFVTLKFLNAIYENLYEPFLDSIIDSEHAEKYYIQIGKYYVQIGFIFKEFIKWFAVVILLMILYNVVLHRWHQ